MQTWSQVTDIQQHGLGRTRIGKLGYVECIQTLESDRICLKLLQVQAGVISRFMYILAVRPKIFMIENINIMPNFKKDKTREL